MRLIGLLVFFNLLSFSSWAQVSSIDQLEKELRGQSMLVRHGAAQKLTLIGGPRVESIFIKLIQRGGVESKRIGLTGLAAVAPQKSELYFKEYLNHPSTLLRWASVLGLGNTADPKWIPELIEIEKNDPGYFKGPNRFPVRETARAAIKKIKMSPRWIYSYDEGLQLARATQKKIILFWKLPEEKWSQKMIDTSFRGEGFKRLKNKFVWIQLDASLQPSLADQWKVSEIPLVQLIDSKEVELERWAGYFSSEVISSDLKGLSTGKLFSTFELENRAQAQPENGEILWDLSQRFEKGQQIDKAAWAWEKIVSLPDSVGTLEREKALFALGFYKGGAGAYSQAIRILKQYIREYPESKEVLNVRYCLALSYLGKGEKRKSLKELQLLSEEDLPDSMSRSVQEVMRKIKESRRRR